MENASANTSTPRSPFFVSASPTLQEQPLHSQHLRTPPIKCVYKQTPSSTRRNLFCNKNNKPNSGVNILNSSNTPSKGDFLKILNNVPEKLDSTISSAGFSPRHSNVLLTLGLVFSNRSASSAIKSAFLQHVFFDKFSSVFKHIICYIALAHSLHSGYHSDIIFRVSDSIDDDSEENEADNSEHELVDNKNLQFHKSIEIAPNFELIRAHKLILSMSSPVFDTMFYGSIPENGGEIQITDVEPQAFRIMLEFLYTGQLLLEDRTLGRLQNPRINSAANNSMQCSERKNVTVTTVLSILYAARKYDIAQLELLICHHLEDRINLASVVSILEAALLYECDFLESKCWHYIEYCTDDFVRSRQFQELPKYILKQVLERNYLSVRELALFDGLQRWANFQVQAQTHEDVNISKNNTQDQQHQQQEQQHQPLELEQIQSPRSVIEDLIYLIRFPCMTSSEFADGPALSGLLNQDEICNVLLYICSVKNKPACLFPCEYRRWKNPHIYSKCACTNDDDADDADSIFSNSKHTGSICQFCQPMQIENINNPTRNNSDFRGNSNRGLAPPTPPRYCSCRTRNFCPGRENLFKDYF